MVSEGSIGCNPTERVLRDAERERERTDEREMKGPQCRIGPSPSSSFARQCPSSVRPPGIARNIAASSIRQFSAREMSRERKERKRKEKVEEGKLSA